MSDNGDLKKEEKPQLIEMRIVAEIGKPVQVHFPFLIDKCVTYGFLKLAEKTLDAHYEQQEKSKIVNQKGGIINFVRKF